MKKRKSKKSKESQKWDSMLVQNPFHKLVLGFASKLPPKLKSIPFINNVFFYFFISVLEGVHVYECCSLITYFPSFPVKVKHTSIISFILSYHHLKPLSMDRLKAAWENKYSSFPSPHIICYPRRRFPKQCQSYTLCLLNGTWNKSKRQTSTPAIFPWGCFQRCSRRWPFAKFLEPTVSCSCLTYQVGHTSLPELDV